jgi:hypothetical protein
MFQHPRGVGYHKFLDWVHRTFLFDWYMEIGCRTGTTFAPVRGKTVAVDPFFQVTTNAIGTKPALHILQQTSDAFFDSGFLQAMNIRLSFSFLDGMHLFEYLLRDFIGTERASDAKGIIALHDCCPGDVGMMTRDLDNLPDGAWVGDVWKLIPILRQYRPDLTLTVLDAWPSGLVLVSGLDPQSTVLADHYDRIVADWIDVALPDYGFDRFYGQFEFVATKPYVESGRAGALFRPLGMDPGGLVIPQKITP